MKNLFRPTVLILSILFTCASFGFAQKTEPAQYVSPSAGDQEIFCDGVDIIDQQTSLSFDIPGETIFGHAVLDVQVAATSADQIILSTKGNWKINSVKVGAKDAVSLYDSVAQKLFVFFDQNVPAGQKMKIEIDYKVIKPKAGAYFINPRLTIPGQPQQIWAQGEPEDNSWWMPTHEMSCFDKMTGSVTLTVPSKFKTISNGNLTASKKLKGGLRRDTWRLDKPHASYLFTFVVGEFDVVKDNSGRVPIEYYVQKGYKGYAKDIFSHTTDLLDFFSERFGPYPWPNYKQIIVEDYTFGAMENTTAVNFHKSFQGTTRELKGSLRNFAVVAHEMAHHWFGDITTTEGWGDLTVNEGFATYAERLTIEHFYGEEAAYEWFKVGRDQYFDQCYGKHDAHPLIDSARAASDPMKMFDRHSYKKGGWILWQLNEMLGDSLFFASCQLYLKTNYYGYATWSDLENAFESTCQQDFSWYFEQWGHNVGHPIIEVNTAVMGDYLVVGLEQTQRKLYGWEEFYLDVPVTIKYGDGEVEKSSINVGNFEFQTTTIPLKSKPLFVVIDPDRVTFVDWHWNTTLQDYQNVLWECTNFPARSDAFDSLIVHKSEISNWNRICDLATDYSSPSITSRGLENVPLDSSYFTEKVVAIYLGEYTNPKVRKAALSRLEGPEWTTTFATLCEDEDLQIQALALQKLLTVDTAQAIQIATAKWATIQKGEPVIHERYMTKALLDVLIHSNPKPVLWKTVCENSGPVVWQEIQGSEDSPGPMIIWTASLDREQREDFFFPYLRKFGNRFEVTLKYFGPKVAPAGSGK